MFLFDHKRIQVETCSERCKRTLELATTIQTNPPIRFCHLETMQNARRCHLAFVVSSENKTKWIDQDEIFFRKIKDSNEMN